MASAASAQLTVILGLVAEQEGLADILDGTWGRTRIVTLSETLLPPAKGLQVRVYVFEALAVRLPVDSEPVGMDLEPDHDPDAVQEETLLVSQVKVALWL